MATTIRDIAKKTGYSVATVSRALSNYGYVSQEKRNVILQCAKEMHYTQNLLAQSMVKGRTKTIGILIADIHDPFYIDLVDKLESLANISGYSVLLCNSNESLEKETKNICTLLERMVDGIIMVPVSDSEESTDVGTPNDYLLHHDTPFVFIDRERAGIDTDIVMLDNFNTALKCMEALINKGYQNICVVSDKKSPKDRMNGVRMACQKKDYPLSDSNWIFCDRETGSVCSLVKQFLLDQKCDALLTLENSLTIGSLKAINELKLEIGRDIYILGFDDIRIYNQLIPATVGVIHQPVEMLCKYAMEMLLERINSKKKIPPRIMRLEGKIQF